MVVVAAIVPQFVLILNQWEAMSWNHIGILLLIAAFLVFIVLKISPRFEPRKKIRFGENSFALYQDDAIHWHLPYSHVNSVDLKRREHVWLNRAHMLKVFNGSGDQLIEQDVEFLSAAQRVELLAELKERMGNA